MQTRFFENFLKMKGIQSIKKLLNNARENLIMK